MHPAFNSPRGFGVGGDTVGLRYSKFLCVSYANLNCLNNKIPHVQLLLTGKNIDILGVGETWLVPSISDSYVAIENYRIFRKDDPSNVKKHGVAVYVKDNIKCVEVPCTLKNIIIIKLVDEDIYVITVYRPPSYTEADNTLMANFILEFCSNREVILHGDFNLPSLRWDLEDPAGGYILPHERTFLEMFTDLELL